MLSCNSLDFAVAEMSKYTLGICHVYDQGLHGVDSEPEGHHLVYHYCQSDEHPLSFLESWQPGDLTSRMEIDDFIMEAKSSMKSRLSRCQNKSVCVKEINSFPKVDIIEVLYLPGGYCVGIKKTHWLSVFQRKWRNYLKTKQQVPYTSIPFKRKYCDLEH